MADHLRKKRANLRDVAQTAGVSVATVSRVLNSPAVVSEDTRVRVQQAIELLHFVPSAAARAINSGRTRMVGALVPTLDNAIFSKFLAAVEIRLGNRGLSLVVATTNGDPEIETSKALGLVEIGAEGLIVSGITHSKAFDDLIKRTRLPAVATSYYAPGYHLPTIGYDNMASSRLALQFLLDAGHTDIGVVHGPAEFNDRTRARIAGLRSLPEGVNLKLFQTIISMEGGATAIGSLIESGTKCSAILCLSDVLAMGAMFELQKRGVNVPGDISVMGVDDLPSTEFTWPAISTVHLPVSKMGHKTADAIADWIEKQVVPPSELLPSRLVIRNSTRYVF